MRTLPTSHGTTYKIGLKPEIGPASSCPLLGGGEPNRIRYLNFDDTGSAERDPDAFNNGLAPAVKLLYAVVVRIATVQPKLAKTFFIRWREAGSPLRTRMWSEIDLNSLFVSPEETGAFLLGLDDRQFWDLHFFPEIAELRARRFCEFDAETQVSVVKRLQRRPPRSHWPRDIDLHEINQGRLYWAVRELRRIEVAGGTLPERAKSWLGSKIQCFPDLATMSICEGFLYGRHRGPLDSPAVDDGYEAVTGISRLERLEAAISGGERKWLDPSSAGALEWLGADGNELLVLKDLESVENGGDQFPTVWNRFGWEHKPSTLMRRTPPKLIYERMRSGFCDSWRSCLKRRFQKPSRVSAIGFLTGFSTLQRLHWACECGLEFGRLQLKRLTLGESGRRR